MNNVVSLESHRSKQDLVQIRVDYIDCDERIYMRKKGQRNTFICEEDTFWVEKSKCKNHYDQEHPRRLKYEVSIIDLVELDSGREFWVSIAQLGYLVGGQCYVENKGYTYEF